jgi:hypothetical protein
MLNWEGTGRKQSHSKVQILDLRGANDGSRYPASWPKTEPMTSQLLHLVNICLESLCSSLKVPTQIFQAIMECMFCWVTKIINRNVGTRSCRELFVALLSFLLSTADRIKSPLNCCKVTFHRVFFFFFPKLYPPPPSAVPILYRPLCYRTSRPRTLIRTCQGIHY